jgi:hypothetical protein
VNADQTRLIVGTLLAAFPRESVTQETVEVYSRMLEDLPYEDTLRAVKRILATRYTFPTIADVRREVFEDRLGLPTAVEVWEQVLRPAITDGEDGPPRDPLVSEVMKATGISRYDVRSSEKPEVLRGQFVKAYEITRRRRLEDENLGSFGEVSRGKAQAEAAAGEVDGATPPEGGEGDRGLPAGDDVRDAAAERGEVG